MIVFLNIVLNRQLIKNNIILIYEDDFGAHHFPISGDPDDTIIFLDTHSKYSYRIADESYISSDLIQNMLRFAGYLDGQVAFAALDDNTLIMLELNQVGNNCKSFKQAIFNAIEETLSEMPDFSTRTQIDGTGLVFRGHYLIGLVPKEDVDDLLDEIPVDVAWAWRNNALAACEIGDIHLLAVPKGYEHLLR